MLKLDITAYSTHKAGTEASYYEDAFAFDTKTGRAAVADGASESFEARDWASLLTQKFVKVPPSPDTVSFLEWLKIPKRVWHVILPWEELAWYAEQKAREVGGLATLVGFYLADEEGKPLSTVADEVKQSQVIKEEAPAPKPPVDFGSEIDLSALVPEVEETVDFGSVIDLGALIPDDDDDEESDDFGSDIDLSALVPDVDEGDSFGGGVDLSALVPDDIDDDKIDLRSLLPDDESKYGKADWLKQLPTRHGGGDPDTAHWSAMAVGDACLFHIRDNQLLLRFPLDEVEAFGTTPSLLSTVGNTNRDVLEHGELQLCSGECQPGDIFLLATDALAERFYDLADLSQLQLGLPDWNSLLQIIEDDFEGLVTQFRDDSLMRNDDVTLLVIRVEE